MTWAIARVSSSEAIVSNARMSAPASSSVSDFDLWNAAISSTLADAFCARSTAVPIADWKGREIENAPSVAAIRGSVREAGDAA